MIKRLFIMFCFAVSCISTTHACDACGCTASGLGIGLMTNYRSNFVKLGYFDTRFHSSPEHGHHNSSDVFSRMNISFRYAFKKLPRLRFTGQIPFGQNKRSSNGDESTAKGLSDIKLIANYVLLSQKLADGKTSIYIEAGGGLSLPTGKYNADIIEENLPENFNLGNGSVGFIFQSNAVLNLENFGFLLNNNFQLNSQTQEGYHFGNQFSSQLTVFKDFPFGNSSLIPNVGVLYENISMDKYSNGNNVPETGGEGYFLSSAINLKTNNWLAGLSYSLPFDQHYSGGVIDAGGRLAIHVSFLF